MKSTFWMKDFFSVCLHFGLGNDLFQNAMLVNHERCAMGSVILSSHEFFQPPNAICVVHAQFLIAKQVEFQAKLVDELVVGFRRILADTQDLVALFRQRFEVVVQVAGLGSASWGVVLGVEIQNQLGAFELLQRPNVAVLVWCRKAWSLVSRFQG